jgi:hypothetical protein
LALSPPKESQGTDWASLPATKIPPSARFCSLFSSARSAQIVGIKGKAGKSEDLIVRFERDGKPIKRDGKPLEWRTPGSGGEFEIAFKASKKIPLGAGKTGHGFVTTTKQGKVSDEVKVPTDESPFQLGTFALRPEPDFVMEDRRGITDRATVETLRLNRPELLNPREILLLTGLEPIGAGDPLRSGKP